MDQVLLLKIAGGFLSSVFVAGIGYLFYQLTSRGGAAECKDGSGRIRMSIWPTLVFPIFLFGLGLALSAHSRMGGDPMLIWVGLPVMIVGLISLTFCLPVHDISWDQAGLSGPSSWTPWPIGPHRIRIEFDQIVKLDKDRYDYWYVENSEGRRIRWNHYYIGFPELSDAISNARPDLF